MARFVNIYKDLLDRSNVLLQNIAEVAAFRLLDERLAATAPKFLLPFIRLFFHEFITAD
jgi:hypothetical protein